MTLPSNWNPLVSTSSRLAFPAPLFENAVSYCRKSRDEMGISRNVEDAPFERYVDLWMFALVIGRSRGKYDADVKLREFIGGDILQGDMARISIVLAIAISHDGNNTQMAANPKQCLKIANCYVAGGLPLVLDAINSGGGKNVENLFRAFSVDVSFD